MLRHGERKEPAISQHGMEDPCRRWEFPKANDRLAWVHADSKTRCGSATQPKHVCENLDGGRGQKLDRGVDVQRRIGLAVGTRQSALGRHIGPKSDEGWKERTTGRKS